ncbi:Bromodomain-containing protein 1 [Colletotrichum sp. SAR 10_71]|nr:Bromodomain-containing protein 1 [Colletotrichum sp. SAR 10_71]KAI8175887.1 Bromodomain-containing protein 1 [Colletotrichum sp. SAR 10_65]
MQNLAPIHLLQSRDGPLDRWRGGLWGMSHSVAHTPLETLFLFQELARTGITTDGFDRAAKALVENELIKTDTSYDAARLTPDALRQLFLNVWTEELATANGTTTSPNSKRRKLNRPPVPTLKEAKQQVAEYPALVERLYARWRDSAVKSIREQEERLIVLAGEITSLDAEERAEKAKAAAPPRPPAPNGTPGPKTTPTPVPIPSTLPNPVQAAAAQPQVKPPAPAPHVEAPRQIRPAPAQATAPTQTPDNLRPVSIILHNGILNLKVNIMALRILHTYLFSRAQAKAHLAPQLATPTPQRSASTPIPPPQTPVTAPPNFLITGSGTKWTNKATPSTPRPSGREIQSPAYEPLSPPQQPAPLPTSTPSQPSKKSSPKPVTKPETKTPRGRGRPPRSANKIRAGSTPSSVVGVPRRSQSVASQTDELSMDHVDLAPRVKDENATPRVTPRATPKPHDETGDTTADESVPSRRNLITPSGVASRLAHKRKRQDTPTDLPAAPPTTVSWTRQFGRVSAAALDQISAHRFANQFANPIRERDAPGYKGLILQPQDIKSIRAAITHGNRTATEAAKGLPDGDPGTGTVILPIGDDLVPPKSIINSAQLERELFHMFSNAVMYNLNPSRGPGPSFVRMETSEGADALGYEVDEDAVVRSTRSMAGEVEKIIGELRNAEKGRSGQDPSTSGNTRPASVATGEDTPMAEDNDADELAGEADITSTTRRRRVGTRN